jgi:membrane-bound lytic murein transglycosylase D
MISALAFGYGVGMAAPEATLASVHDAVAGYHEAPRVSTANLPPVSQVTRVTASGIGGDESRELSRLREIGARDAPKEKGESCELDRPLFSKLPHYESRMDRDVMEADDLDAAGSEALSRLQLPDLRISVTKRTLKYVRFFTRSDRGRGMFETWLKRSGRFQELIQTELRDRRLPEDLMWVAMIESGFDPRAKSPAGAVGLWQFMPSTADVYGLAQTKHLDQRKNPRLATQAATHHLRDLYYRFGGWDLALAAYNMGYEQLLDTIDKYGTADFNELARQEAIPAETAAYVPKIAAAAIIANNLEHFGFDKVEIQRPVDAAEITAPPGTPLRTIAKAAGVSTATLRTINPDILGERVPPGHGDYIVQIPADTVARARAALPVMLETEPLVVGDDAALDPIDMLQSKELFRRRAQSEDDSLLSLLPHYKRRGSLRSPLDADDGDEPSSSARDDDEHDAPLVDRVDRDVDGPRRILGHKPRHRRETLVYRVAAGDTLVGIARQFATDADDVARRNGLDGEEKLKAGSLLKLRVRRDLLDDLPSAAEKDDKDRDDKSGKAHPHAVDKHHKKARPDAT